MYENASFAKPEGKEGEDLLDSMDVGHTPVSLWSLTKICVKEDDVTLDIGCGSGLNIKRLYEKSSKAMSYGVDYSSTSVKKSVMMNKEYVDKGMVEVVEANVLSMPFEDEMFDIITAFETVYFWPDIVDSFKEVKRILKNDGKFFIVMDANGIYTPRLEEVAKKENCVFYTDKEITDLLVRVGYSRIKVFIRQRRDDNVLVKEIMDDNYSEELLDDNYPMDIYEDSDDENITSPEWYCVIAEK